MSILDRFALDGHVAVVTGAGRGIGEGIAVGLAEAGCDVVLTARRQNEIDAVAEKVRALGRRALAIPGDITDGAFVDDLADRAKDEMGQVTIWVSNAGGADDRTPRHLADMPDRQWDYQLDLNLRAVFTGSRAAARVLDDGGSIINISSGAALKPSPNNGPYAVAKAGVDSLTRTMSTELAPRGIRVNGVAPGPVPTEVFMEFFGASEEDIPTLGKKLGVPLGRLGTPDDVANAVVFLASDAASWVTGQTLLVNGGNR
ncbi:SDR family NAD(P)-dependent oxidoreductase [Ilumatobacter nonamiensis]|uniref:SDR family NAD(P)-dependent oxidoreductase n=1 Tax=Ilumatobacter nonamiensis TaxID=467093 RepID=UPI00034BE265|nr:SDR family oxidoreductase [Ilumatobacter nonamiensis]